MADPIEDLAAQGAAAANEAPSFDDLAWKARGAFRYHAGSCLRYHRRRQRFFDGLDKLTKTLTVAVATTFLADLSGQKFVASIFASLTLLDLIFGYGDRRNQHQRAGDMAAELFESIEGTPLDRTTTETAARWGALYAKLLAFAPPTLKCLKLICEREQSIADGKREHADNNNPEQPGWRRFIADIF